MKKRKRRVITRVGTAPMIPGIGWYSREQYDRLLEVSEDRDGMSPTWEGWEEKAREVLSFLQSEGIPAREVSIDVEDMISWCEAQKRAVNGAARAEFISLKCRELPAAKSRTH